MPTTIINLATITSLAGFTVDAGITVSGGKAIITPASTGGYAIYNTADTAGGRQVVRATVRCDTATTDQAAGIFLRTSGPNNATLTGYIMYMRWLLGSFNAYAQGIYIFKETAGSASIVLGQQNIGSFGVNPTGTSTIQTGVDYVIEADAGDARVDFYCQRLSDNLYLRWDGVWQNNRLSCAGDNNPAVNGVTGAGTAGILLTAADSTGSTYIESFFFGEVPLAQTPTTGTAYVNPSTGNDETGVVGNAVAPYASINAALTSLTSGTVSLSTGRHANVLAASVADAQSASVGEVLVPAILRRIKSNITYSGAGMAAVDPTGLKLNESTGTVINGPFGYFADINNLNAHDLGIDAGQYVMQTVNGMQAGAATNTAVWSGALGNSASPAPATGRVITNVSALNQVGVFNHCHLFEAVNNVTATNLVSYLGFAGLVVKCETSTFTRIRCFGNGFGGYGFDYGIIIKSNHYANCDNCTLQDIYIDQFVGVGGGAVSQLGGSLSFNNNDSTGGSTGATISNITVSDVVVLNSEDSKGLTWELGTNGVSGVVINRFHTDGTPDATPGSGATVNNAAAPTSLVINAPTIANGIATFTATIQPNPTSATGAAQVIFPWTASAGAIAMFGDYSPSSTPATITAKAAQNASISNTYAYSAGSATTTYTLSLSLAGTLSLSL